MIELLKETELEYIRCFSKETIEQHVRRFRDENFKDSYANNICILKDKVKDEELISVINMQIDNAIKRNEYFLHFEIHGNIDKSIIKRLKIKPNRIDTLIYMTIDVKKYNDIKTNNCMVKEALTNEALKKVIDINVEDYAPIVGRAYASKRINRKIDAYKADDNNLMSIICCDSDVPVGSCEVISYKNIVKIEDFGVLNKYQHRGFGSSILRYVIEKACKENKDIAYVITEKNSVASDIYRKLGFNEVAEKTQIIFDF